MNYSLKNVILFVMSTSFWCNTYCITDKNWFFHTPEGTGMGLFLALALPVDIFNRNVYLSYNFEVNYQLPGNTSDVEYPQVINEERKRVTRYINRRLVYDALQEKINQFGYDGYNCLLKLICEFPMSIFVHNGIFSDILHIILLPSSSKHETLHSDFVQAEMNGRKNNCSIYNKCPSDVLSTILSVISY